MLPVPLRDLWSPERCPVPLLPYLAWAFSVDRWDETWPEQTKRAVTRDAFFIHQHKGTLGALRRAVEPLGYLIKVVEWWQNNDAPGTFRLQIGVLDTGITEAMFQELERLIDDAKPLSRHLAGLVISMESRGCIRVGSVTLLGDIITVYPYSPPELAVTGLTTVGAAVQLIDTLSIYP